jgi:hypothetical protein
MERLAVARRVAIDESDENAKLAGRKGRDPVDQRGQIDEARMVGRSRGGYPVAHFGKRSGQPRPPWLCDRGLVRPVRLEGADRGFNGREPVASVSSGEVTRRIALLMPMPPARV